MLPKKNRLTRKEINLLKSRKNQIFQGKFFGIIYKDSDDFKVGVIISNKVVAKAVDRNKVKRSLYLAIESKITIKKGQILFLAKRNCLEAKKDDFEKEVENFAKQYQLSSKWNFLLWSWFVFIKNIYLLTPGFLKGFFWLTKFAALHRTVQSMLIRQ